MTLSGLFIPLITPLDETGAVALNTLQNLALGVLAEGAAGLVALGTTGEPSALTDAESRAVIEVAARVCREQQAPLIVGANTADALQALAAIPEVTAALCLVPPFVRPGEAGVIAHFTALAAASPVPIVVYDVPYRTGQYLCADAMRRLAAIPGIIGVKYAVGGIDTETLALLADPPAGFAILGGDDVFVSPLLALGAHGAILASAHVATAQFADLIAAWHAGDVTTARALGHRLSPLSTALFAEPNPTVTKAVLHAIGKVPTPSVRLPLVPATEKVTATALTRLASLNGAAGDMMPRQTSPRGVSRR